jgi:phenylacetate-CoA ligase
MNPLLNPLFFGRVFKWYLEDPTILRRMNNEELKRYQNHAFKAMLTYAYTVPVYHEKYMAAGIHPNDIGGLQDIKKLPFITKEDLRRNFPTNVVPSSFQTKKAIVAATSGTTGRSLSLYTDLPTVIRSMLGFRRALLEHHIPWQKTKMSLLLDLSENSFENEYFIHSILSTAKRIIPTNHFQILDILRSPIDLIQQINHFEPEVILGYPFVLIQLAILKNRGYGEKITPKWIGTSGAVCDPYSKRFVEEAFHSRLFDIYAATESGIMAFECEEGRYHVCSDLVFLECLQNGDDAPVGSPGLLTVTRLYGKGTPLIRYRGIDDVVTVSHNDCSCGFTGDVLEGIHGRKSESIMLPDGRMVLISVFEHCIAESLYEIKVNKIKRIQIVQNRIDAIEVRILFDDYLRDAGCSADETLSMLHYKLQERLGPQIEIHLKEVERFDDKAPYILSTIDRTHILEKNYLV